MWWNDQKKVGNQRKQLEMVGDITYVTYIYIIIYIYIFIIFVYIFWVGILKLSRYSLRRSSQVQGRTPSYFRGRVYLCMQG